MEHDKFAGHCLADGGVEDLHVFAGIENEAVLDSGCAVEQAFAWIPVVEAEAGRARQEEGGEGRMRAVEVFQFWFRQAASVRA